MRRPPWLPLLSAALFAAALPAQKPAVAATPAAPRLRLVHILEGLRSDAPGRDLARLGETPFGKEAARLGLDLAHPANPLVAAAFDQGRLFHLFYKVVDDAFGDRAWLLQRTRKVERTWATADAEPEQKVSYQVEAFKTMAGTLKSADEHFGSYGLRDAHRREIVKEYEFGFGDVAGTAEGAAWPFAADRLFHMLQPYGEVAGLYDKVKFTSSRGWTLTVSFGQDGSYAIRAPELGIDLPNKNPDPALARPLPDATSKAIVLTPGVGLPGVRIGASTVADVTKVLGAPIEDVPASKTNRNVSYRGSLTCNFDGAGRLNTVITRASFAGRTENGVAHGMIRADVRQKLGAPAGQGDDAETWSYAGLLVMFDGFGTVSRIVILRP